MPHTSLNESHVSLVNQSLYSSVEIIGTKSLKDQDHIYACREWSINWLPTDSHAVAAFHAVTKKLFKHSHVK